MKILFKTRPIKFWNEHLQSLQNKHAGIQFITNYHEMSNSEQAEALKSANAIVSGRITNEELSTAESLEWLFVPFAGVNQLPFEAIQKHEISVSNAHGNAAFTAERAMALTMALLGKVVFYHNELGQGRWHRSHNTEDLWDTIHNKKCVILGYGSIGQALAIMLKPFHCKITAIKRNRTNKTLPCCDHVSYDIDQALAENDIIFVCLPLTTLTNNILNKDRLMKLHGKFMVNIGRGELINEAGLYASLQQNILKGAALDVWYQYPGQDKQKAVYPSTYPFHQLENVVMSPHKASHCTEAVRQNIAETAKNIDSWLTNGKPDHIVDSVAGY